MSRPPLPPTLRPTTSFAASTPAMTETQSPPNIPPSSFYAPPYSRHLPHPGPILPPLSIPGPPQRPDIHFRSPITTSNTLPSILNPAPSRPPPPRRHGSGAAPVERLLTSQPQPYTPPPKTETYSPAQYGPPLSPRSEAEARLPRAPLEQQYRYEDQRPRYPDSTLTSPIEQTQPQAFAPLPSPGYTPSYTSTTREPGSHRSSTASSLGALAPYQEAVAPATQSVRAVRASASSINRPPPPPIIEKR